MTESVVVTQGRNRYEFTYSEYNDYNNPLNLIEVYMPGRMMERRNGEVVRDVKTVVTETGSVYVVVPVPSNVGPTQPLPMYGSDQQPPVLDSNAPTPRLANGKPDLTGSWRSDGNKFFIWRYGNRRCAPTQLDGCSPQWNQTVDFEFEAASRFGPNRPIYKPEHWDEVVYLDMWTNRVRSDHDLSADGSFRDKDRPGASSTPRTTSPYSTVAAATAAAVIPTSA